MTLERRWWGASRGKVGLYYKDGVGEVAGKYG